jgi:hypothetical protein
LIKILKKNVYIYQSNIFNHEGIMLHLKLCPKCEEDTDENNEDKNIFIVTSRGIKCGSCGNRIIYSKDEKSDLKIFYTEIVKQNTNYRDKSYKYFVGNDGFFWQILIKNNKIGRKRKVKLSSNYSGPTIINLGFIILVLDKDRHYKKLEREKGYLYFTGKDGNLWAAPMKYNKNGRKKMLAIDYPKKVKFERIIEPGFWEKAKLIEHTNDKPSSLNLPTRPPTKRKITVRYYDLPPLRIEHGEAVLFDDYHAKEGENTIILSFSSRMVKEGIKLKVFLDNVELGIWEMDKINWDKNELYFTCSLLDNGIMKTIVIDPNGFWDQLKFSVYVKTH